MRYDIIDRWLSALRSGLYNRGGLFLTMRYGKESWRHTPYGILCELAANKSIVKFQELTIPFAKWHIPNITIRVYGHEGSRTELPNEVLKWLELESLDKGTKAILNAMNEDDRVSFDEFASYFEKYAIAMRE